jgi:hypothetical protein
MRHDEMTSLVSHQTQLFGFWEFDSLVLLSVTTHYSQLLAVDKEVSNTSAHRTL